MEINIKGELLLTKTIEIFGGKIVAVDDKRGEWKMVNFDQVSAYKPEAPNDGGFEPFKYEGKVIIEKSMISVNERVDTEFYPKGCTQIEIEATVLDSKYAGRKLFKRFNLDDEKEDKKGKTALKKLADQLWAVGLTFKNMEELEKANNEFVGMQVEVKAWAADFKDDRPKQQMWNIKGIAKSKDGLVEKPKF